jgi:LPXTG-motif cell wall-anchored protein
MDPTTIRIIAGVLFVVVLGIIIWRRKRKTLE